MKHAFYATLLALLLALPLCPAFADDHEEPAPAEETDVSEETEGESVEVEVEIEAPDTPGAGEIDGHIEALDIENEGIQFNFINSNVTISGGTINATMSNVQGGDASVEQDGEESQPKPNGRPGGQRPQQPDKPDPFAEAIKDATKAEGLFTVWTKEDLTVHWEIKPGQLEKDFLLNAKMATSIPEAGLEPGAYIASNIIDGGPIIYFKQRDKVIDILQRNVYYNAEPGSAEARTMEKTFHDSLIAAIPYPATNPETGAYLIDMTNLFLADQFQVNRSLPGGYGLDRQNSYVKESNVNPENVQTRVRYQYRTGANFGVDSQPDGRSVPIEILIDIQPLRDNPEFVKREPDYRIGYFLGAQYDIGDDRNEAPFDRFICKWDIRKASPELEMSPPVKPVVVWLQNTIPPQYRKGVHDGILAWNKAFENIGIKGAIEVKQQPDDADWDASDLRYNMAHWIETPGGGGYAYAQWVHDPRTGEILNGGFIFQAEWIRMLYQRRPLEEPDLAKTFKEWASDPRLLKEPLPDHDHALHKACTYGEGLARQYADALIMLEATNGPEGISDELMEEYIYQFLFELSAHEFGHSLGLRHNFRASTMLSMNELYDESVTSETGLAASVMDYNPVIYAPEGKDQGDYWQTTVGPYDMLAIEYGYKEIKAATDQTEADVLAEIAERQESSDKYAFGTDEDADFFDPLIQRYDFSKEPLEFAMAEADRALNTIPKLPSLLKEGDDYSQMRYGFASMVNRYLTSAFDALLYLGGTHINKVKKGGAYDGKMPLEPVSTAKQREALRYILDRLYSTELFEKATPEMLQKMNTITWYHRGASMRSPSDYPILNIASNFYESTLFWIFSPATVSDILDNEQQTAKNAVKFTVPELFESVEQSVWAEVYDLDEDSLESAYSNQEPMISPYRRMLQRKHLSGMIATALQPYSSMPEEGRNMAWLTLKSMHEKIEDAVEETLDDVELDDYTKAHLEETLVKLERALDAEQTVGVDFW